jgi:hypothetical protein
VHISGLPELLFFALTQEQKSDNEPKQGTGCSLAVFTKELLLGELQEKHELCLVFSVCRQDSAALT